MSKKDFKIKPVGQEVTKADLKKVKGGLVDEYDPNCDDRLT